VLRRKRSGAVDLGIRRWDLSGVASEAFGEGRQRAVGGTPAVGWGLSSLAAGDGRGYAGLRRMEDCAFWNRFPIRYMGAESLRMLLIEISESLAFVVRPWRAWLRNVRACFALDGGEESFGPLVLAIPHELADVASYIRRVSTHIG